MTQLAALRGTAQSALPVQRPAHGRAADSRSTHARRAGRRAGGRAAAHGHRARIATSSRSAEERAFVERYLAWSACGSATAYRLVSMAPALVSGPGPVVRPADAGGERRASRRGAAHRPHDDQVPAPERRRRDVAADGARRRGGHRFRSSRGDRRRPPPPAPGSVASPSDSTRSTVGGRRSHVTSSARRRLHRDGATLPLQRDRRPNDALPAVSLG